MGWRVLWYGAEQPSRTRVFVTNLAIGLTVLGGAGLLVRFVPAPPFQDGRIAVAFGLIGVVLTALLFGNAERIGNMQKLVAKGWLHFALVLLLIVTIIPPFIGLFCWAAFGKALPWAYTRVFGQPHEERTIMLSHSARSRRSCDYRLEGGVMDATFPDYVCIRESFYRENPEQEVEVVLYGRQSALGFSVIGVRSVE